MSVLTSGSTLPSKRVGSVLTNDLYIGSPNNTGKINGKDFLYYAGLGLTKADGQTGENPGIGTVRFNNYDNMTNKLSSWTIPLGGFAIAFDGDAAYSNCNIPDYNYKDASKLFPNGGQTILYSDSKAFTNFPTSSIPRLDGERNYTNVTMKQDPVAVQDKNDCIVSGIDLPVFCQMGDNIIYDPCANELKVQTTRYTGTDGSGTSRKPIDDWVTASYDKYCTKNNLVTGENSFTKLCLTYTPNDSELLGEGFPTELRKARSTYCTKSTGWYNEPGQNCVNFLQNNFTGPSVGGYPSITDSGRTIMKGGCKDYLNQYIFDPQPNSHCHDLCPVVSSSTNPDKDKGWCDTIRIRKFIQPSSTNPDIPELFSQKGYAFLSDQYLSDLTNLNTTPVSTINAAMGGVPLSGTQSVTTRTLSGSVNGYDFGNNCGYSATNPNPDINKYYNVCKDGTSVYSYEDIMYSACRPIEIKEGGTGYVVGSYYAINVLGETVKVIIKKVNASTGAIERIVPGFRRSTGISLVSPYIVIGGNNNATIKLTPAYDLSKTAFTNNGIDYTYGNFCGCFQPPEFYDDVIKYYQEIYNVPSNVMDSATQYGGYAYHPACLFKDCREAGIKPKAWKGLPCPSCIQIQAVSAGKGVYINDNGEINQTQTCNISSSDTKIVDAGCYDADTKVFFPKKLDGTCDGSGTPATTTTTTTGTVTPPTTTTPPPTTTNPPPTTTTPPPTTPPPTTSSNINTGPDTQTNTLPPLPQTNTEPPSSVDPVAVGVGVGVACVVVAAVGVGAGIHYGYIPPIHLPTIHVTE